MARILAAADIGSNTAHLLVARTDGTTLTRIINRNDWIALGEVVARQGRIPTGHQSRIVSTLKTFKAVASKALAETIFVFGTEAMRAAANTEDVARAIRDKTGLRMNLISPEREAALGWRGVMLDVPQDESALLFEVGGGSAQIAVVRKGTLKQDFSLPIGTGRLIAEAEMRNPCPPGSIEKAQTYLAGKLALLPDLAKIGAAVSSGGVGRGIWRALHPDGERRLLLEEIEYLIWATSRLPADRIASRFGVRLHRAETLLPGALVYRQLFRQMDIASMTVSEFGVREGAILEMAEGKIAGQNL